MKKVVDDRPVGKIKRMDRDAIRHLWSLLYRAVRRHAVRVDVLEARVARLEEELRGGGPVPDETAT